MKSNGGVLSADEVVHQPITTVLSGPAAGALGAALIAKVAGFDKVLTSDGGGTSTDVSVVIDGEPTLTTEGSVGAFPSKIPMIDVVTVGAGGGSIAWLSPEGTLKVGPQSAGADPGPLCYGKGGTEVTITDAHVFLGRIPPHLLGGEIPLDVDAAEGRHRAARRRSSAYAPRPAPPASSRSPRGTRPTRCARSPSSAASTSATSRSPRSAAPGRCCSAGWWTSSASRPCWCRPTRATSRRSACSPSTSRTTTCRPTSPSPTSSTRHAVAGIYDALTAQAAEALAKEGFEPAEHQFVAHRRPALLRPGLRGAGAGPEPATSTRPRSPTRSTPSTRRSTATTSPATPPSRSSGSTSGSPASARSSARRSSSRPVVSMTPARCTSPATVDQRDSGLLRRRRGVRRARRSPAQPTWRPATVVDGPAIIEEFGSTVPLHPGFTARIDEYLNIIVTRSARHEQVMSSRSAHPPSSRSAA